VTATPTVALVVDEHLMALRVGLEHRGILVRTVGDLGATSIRDPDVIRAIARKLSGPWVMVTMDGTIVEEHPNFEWDRYAIAWVVVDPKLRGVAVEQAKNDIVHHHAKRMLEQRPPDHFTYTQTQRHKSPPSLVSTLRRADPFRNRPQGAGRA
jgi:hypothetical protein